MQSRSAGQRKGPRACLKPHGKWETGRYLSQPWACNCSVGVAAGKDLRLRWKSLCCLCRTGQETEFCLLAKTLFRSGKDFSTGKDSFERLFSKKSFQRFFFQTLFQKLFPKTLFQILFRQRPFRQKLFCRRLFPKTNTLPGQRHFQRLFPETLFQRL